MARKLSKPLVLAAALAKSDVPLDVLKGLSELEPDMLGDMVWIAFARKAVRQTKEENHG